MNIAYVTYNDQGKYHAPNVENEDEKLLEFLKNKDLNITSVIWNDPSVKWENYDIAVLKSPWDYFDLINDFYSWLAEIKKTNIRLLNPLDIVKWNSNKHYLKEIEAAGFNVTPSAYITQNSKIDLEVYFSQFNTNKLIVKPCVSGGSKNTFKVDQSNYSAIEIQLDSLIKAEDFIVQPFINEIEAQGEWSYLFFNGKFSHALLKKAKPGDFRVQHSFGGSIHSYEPNTEQLDEVTKFVDAFAKDCLYARVDGTYIENNFVLMELELIEPFLFLDTNPKAYENYYNALTALI